MSNERQAILAGLDAFIRQRPGLEFGNYGEVRAYRAELRQITKDLHDARTLLRAVELSSITADGLREAFRAYSGRLTLHLHRDTLNDGGRWTATLDYCTGQYWPTEYRKAVCAVAAAALWDYYRDDIAVDHPHRGDELRAKFRRMFGRSIANRWFN